MKIAVVQNIPFEKNYWACIIMSKMHMLQRQIESWLDIVIND